MNVLTMPPHLGHSDSLQATTLLPAGFTTSARLWKDCIASEQMQCRYLKTGVSAVFIIGFFVSLTYALCHL